MDLLLQSLVDAQRQNMSNLESANTMINHLLSLQESKPEYYTDELIKGVALVMILAGTDTSAVTTVPLLVPHRYSSECTIGGYDIPRDAMLLVNAWSIQRDPKFWDDATSFKPERFETLDIKEGEAFQMFPFGVGRRSCPGATLANRVVRLALGSLIQCFEWERVDDMKIDMAEGRGITMPKAESLLAMCKARSISSKLLFNL
ncbi:hypothetical protein ACFE04_024330 [Oxalis oulophora]